MLAELDLLRGPPVSQILVTPPPQSLSAGCCTRCGGHMRFGVFPSPNPLYDHYIIFGSVSLFLDGFDACLSEHITKVFLSECMP